MRDQLRDRPSADERWREAKEEWERQVARQIEEAELKRSAAVLAEATASAKEGGMGEHNERLSAMAMIKAEDEERAKAAEARAKAEDERRRSDAEAAAKASGCGTEETRRPLDAIEEASEAPTPRQTSPRSIQGAPEATESPPPFAGDAGLVDFEAVLSTRSRSALPPELGDDQASPAPQDPPEH